MAEWKFLNVDTELVGEWEVGVSTSNNTVVVNYNDLLVGDLSLRVLEDSISVNIPWIVNAVVVKDALLLGHDHVFVSIQEINNAKLIRRHARGREEASRWESVTLDDSDQVVRSRDWRNVSDVSSVELEWVETKKFRELWWGGWSSLARVNLSLQ